MARISGNVAMNGARGRLGEIYYRFRYGNQEVCKMPAKSTKPRSPAQLARQELMKEANIYYRKIEKDPEKMAWYKKMAEQKGKTDAYHAVISHYLTSPRLRDVDFHECAGESGDSIGCRATAWNAVVSVVVIIRDHLGAVVESGAAQKGEDDWWLYTISETIARWPAATVVFEITDDLDHIKTREMNPPA